VGADDNISIPEKKQPS